MNRIKLTVAMTLLLVVIVPLQGCYTWGVQPAPRAYQTLADLEDAFKANLDEYNETAIIPDNIDGFSSEFILSDYGYSNYTIYGLKYLKYDKTEPIRNNFIGCKPIAQVHTVELDNSEFTYEYNGIPYYYSNLEQSNDSKINEDYGEPTFSYHELYVFEMQGQRYKLDYLIAIPLSEMSELNPLTIKSEISEACLNIVKQIIDKGANLKQ